MRSAAHGIGLAVLHLEFLDEDGAALTAGEARLTSRKPDRAAF